MPDQKKQFKIHLDSKGVQLTFEQKIELLKIANTTATGLGGTHNGIEETLKNYKKILEALQ